MAGVIVNVGEEVGLKALVGHTPGQNLVLRLFTNNKTPAQTDVASDYTELVGFGYVPKTLTGGLWTYTAGDPGTLDAVIQTWTFSSAPGNLYGVFFTQELSGILVLVERFTGAPLTPAGALSYIPRITMRTQGGP
jgi:hypothetical protein